MTLSRKTLLVISASAGFENVDEDMLQDASGVSDHVCSCGHGGCREWDLGFKREGTEEALDSDISKFGVQSTLVEQQVQS